MPEDAVILEASVDSLYVMRERVTFRRNTNRNEVEITMETFAEVAVSLVDKPQTSVITVSTIALRSAAEVILDGPDAKES